MVLFCIADKETRIAAVPNDTIAADNRTNNNRVVDLFFFVSIIVIHRQSISIINSMFALCITQQHRQWRTALCDSITPFDFKFKRYVVR